VNVLHQDGGSNRGARRVTELRASQFTCLKKRRMTNDMRLGGGGGDIRNVHEGKRLLCRSFVDGKLILKTIS
jgi:hypothetical protein